MRIWIKLGAAVVVAVLAACLFVAWRDARKEQAALKAELKTTQQALAEATARQASRDAAVNDLVAGLKKREAETRSPAQVVAALPGVIALPEPITLEPEKTSAPKQPSGAERPASESGPYKSTSSVPDGVLPKLNFPAADLKPLYDFAVECKACQAKLGAAQADLADERLKSQALGRERDAARATR